VLVAVAKGRNEIIPAIAAAVHQGLTVLDCGSERRSLRSEEPSAVKAAKTLRLCEFMPDAFAATAEAHWGSVPPKR
jgi:hypothetical protein